MPPSLIPVPITPLRDLGVDERWLQERIHADPSILGLGTLTSLRREKNMIGGGRLDLLLGDVGDEVRYEVEVMLGALDPSHLVRTLEYWDIERRRYPEKVHIAVLVAEDVSSRFLNVIALLNKSIPLIALRMTAVAMPGGIGLVFTKVIDLASTFGDAEVADVAVSRRAWEESGYAESLAVLDRIADLIRAGGAAPRITYNQGHIAVALSGRNCLWFFPRKKAGICTVEWLVDTEQVGSWAAAFADWGFSGITEREETIKVPMSVSDVERVAAQLREAIAHADAQAR
jgi:hypothetical protein